ncbi:Zinc finger CCCH domain-containing protein [Quillaja saponaria]|uniref:Zinc finger CCCH domain-containing protein n=1 Tax=Quillaja saponaria TaxID=32244 RepID=A0AAD7LLL2_QUISA|nr:Zinc finger CCCH domain-containing protein [Quillaja saponaria]
MPVDGELSQQNIKDRYYGVNDPVAAKLLNKAGEMSSLKPPEDESIRTLYVGGLDGRVTEQDLRDHFYAHGEIESIKMVLQRAYAFVTYTTRDGAEKAAEELSNKLVIKGLRLKLMWGKPQASKPELENPEQARQQASVALSGMLPRAVISQQQNQLQPPGTQDPSQPLQYFSITPPIQQERSSYPSMDPQRMGAIIPSQEGAPGGPTASGEIKSSLGNQQQVQHYAQLMPPPPGQYHQNYPYGYMHSAQPPYHHFAPPYNAPMHPSQPPPLNHSYQHSGPSGSVQMKSGQQGSAPAESGSSTSGSAQQGK